MLFGHFNVKKLLVFFCFCFNPLFSLSNDTILTGSNTRILGIDEIVQIVLENNPSLKVSEKSINFAKAAIISASALPNPFISIETGENISTGSSSLPGNLTSIGISQLIENPILRNARIKVATQAETTSIEFLSFTKNELVGKVKLKTFEYLLRKEQATASKDSLELLEQIRKRVKVRVDTGESGKYELIKADAEIVNARQLAETARLQIAQAVISLNRLAAGKMPNSWILKGQLNDKVKIMSLIDIKKIAIKNNPELRLLQSELKRNFNQIEEAEASKWKGVELKFSQFRQPELEQNLIGFSIEIPIFDKKIGPRDQAIADKEKTLAKLDGRKRELIQQIELSWKSLEISRMRIKALSEGAMRQAEAALRVAEAAYKFGEKGILEVLDAERVLRSVRANLIQARFQLQISQVELETLSGKYAY